MRMSSTPLPYDRLLTMRPARPILCCLLLVVSALVQPVAAAAQAIADSADGLKSGAVFEALARMDSLLFEASFASCDAVKANAIFTDDVEFYHDQTGLMVGEQVRENTRRLTASCPRSHGVTRTLIPGSLRVYPIDDYGAVQMGVHRFDERGASSSTLTRFVHVWRLEHGTWRLARVLSLDHHAVPSQPRGQPQ